MDPPNSPPTQMHLRQNLGAIHQLLSHQECHLISAKLFLNFVNQSVFYQPQVQVIVRLIVVPHPFHLLQTLLLYNLPLHAMKTIHLSLAAAAQIRAPEKNHLHGSAIQADRLHFVTLPMKHAYLLMAQKFS